MKSFKTGDRVIPWDGSWALGAKDNEFVHKCGSDINGRVFEVIATDLKVPAMGYNGFEPSTTYGGKIVSLDLLIQAIDNKEYVFIMSTSVKPASEGKKVTFEEAMRLLDCVENTTIIWSNGEEREVIPNSTWCEKCISPKMVRRGKWYAREAINQ